jgi:shikimate kinase
MTLTPCLSPKGRGEQLFLTLIGYRATGKTTVARLLAGRLAWEWADSDPEVERRLGAPIQQIFAEYGEPVFRDVEARVIAELCRRDRLVLAVGGGAPLRPETRELLRTRGKVVWLTAGAETIAARMAADPTTADRRPRLTGKTTREEIAHLLAVRQSVYREAADVVVDTEGKHPEEVAGEIIRRLQVT